MCGGWGDLSWPPLTHIYLSVQRSYRWPLLTSIDPRWPVCAAILPMTSPDLLWPPLTDLRWPPLTYLSVQRAYCAFCSVRIWGLGRQGYKCVTCKLLVHKRCHKRINLTCGATVVSYSQPHPRTTLLFLAVKIWPTEFLRMYAYNNYPAVVLFMICWFFISGSTV